MTPRITRAASVARQLWHEWQRDNAMMLAAAVAFYATFSLAPLLLILLKISAILLGRETARARLLEFVGDVVSPKAAVATDRIIEAASGDSTGTTVVSVLVLVVSASAVFRYLKLALNVVLDVPTKEERGFYRILRKRLVATVIAIAAIVLLVGALGATAAIAWLAENAPGRLQWEPLWSALRLLLTFIVLAAGFAAILKFVPDMDLRWRHVAIGSALAAVTFSGGQLLIASYLARSSLTTAYGAAGSFVLLLVYIYFTVAVLFAAAELTEVLARDDAEFRREREHAQEEEHHVPRKAD
jgi:membrane protein